MKINDIPNSLLTRHQKEDELISFIYLYENQSGIEKSKVSLSTFLFSFVLSGKKELNYLSRFATIKSNEFLLLKPGSCLMSERIPANESYRAFLLFFNSQLFKNISLDTAKTTATIKNNGDFLLFPKDDFVTSYIHSIEQLKNTGMDLFNHISVVKLQELLNYLIHQYGRVVVDFLQDSVQSSSEEKLKTIVEKNVDRKLSMDKLAFLCSMSLSTFNRKFKALYGTSPSKWFLKQRLIYSKRQISVMGKKPSEVYFDAGFENLSSFTNAFKKEFGELPSHVQKMSK